MALQLNEYAAKEVVAKHPDRFGFFAFLPMPGRAACPAARHACCPLHACQFSMGVAYHPYGAGRFGGGNMHGASEGCCRRYMQRVNMET